MATPHVSGIAALVWSLDTTKSAAEIRGILETSAEDLGSQGRDNSYGHGLVRADRAGDILEGFTMMYPTTSTDVNGAEENRSIKHPFINQPNIRYYQTEESNNKKPGRLSFV